MRNALLNEGRVKREVEEEVNCTWTIQVEKAKLMKNTKSLYWSFDELKINSVTFQTEKNLYLLVTFHNLSAPFTVDCEGAYIEVFP